MLSPEAQTLYAGVAGFSAILGLFIWGAGIKIARPAVAILLGLTAAGFAAWGLPGLISVSPITAALIGFVAGVLTGAVTFRFLQGALLASCLALTVSGVYYRFEAPKPPAGAAVATLPADKMLIAPERLAASPDNAALPVDASNPLEIARNVGGTIERTVRERWDALPSLHRQRMIILAALTALLALLLALFFPRHTTWIATAALGASMLMLAAVALMQVYAPQYSNLMPSKSLPLYGTLGVMMLVGMVMQRAMFWPSRKKARPAAPVEAPAAA